MDGVFDAFMDASCAARSNGFVDDDGRHAMPNELPNVMPNVMPNATAKPTRLARTVRQ